MITVADFLDQTMGRKLVDFVLMKRKDEKIELRLFYQAHGEHRTEVKFVLDGECLVKDPYTEDVVLLMKGQIT